MAFVLFVPASGQLSYLGKTFQFEDGVYGMRGTRSMCFSHDKQNLYVCSQYALAVFSFDTINGELAFLEAYKNLTDGITGISGSGTVVVSPDDKFIYVTGYDEHRVALFGRNQENGLLEFITTFNNEENGNIGLRGPDGMKITSDGEYMYFAAGNSPKISAYKRNPNDGNISHLQSIGEYDEGGMPRPHSLVLNRDNRFLYVISVFVDAIHVFEIDPSTGLLQFIQQTEPITGLWNTQALEVSHDDEFLYLACWDNLLIFKRDIQSGLLSFKTLFNADDTNINGLHALYSLSASPDDKNIYTLSAEDTAFATFSRNLNTDDFQFVQSQPFMHPWSSNPQHSSYAMLSTNQFVLGNSYWESATHITERDQGTGLLTYHGNVYEGLNAIVDGLYNPRHSCSDHGNNHVFVTTPTEGISMLSRNDTTGLLSHESVINNDSLGNLTLRYAYMSMVSLDDKYLYTGTGFGSHSCILTFEIDHSNHKLIIVDSIITGQNGISNASMIRDITMSPDLKDVYMVGYMGVNDIFQFKYNPLNGALDYIRSYDFDNTSNSFTQLKITKNGEYIFLASSTSNVLMMLRRDSESGELSHLLKFRHNLPGGVYVSGLKTMDVSHDSKNLYISYRTDYETLVNFGIDMANDTLSILQIIEYETNSSNRLQKIDNIKVRHDGTFVFTSSRENHSLGFFYREPYRGMLTFIHNFTEPEWNFDGLDGINWITLPPNDRNLYLISDYEEGIASYKIDLYLGPDLSICEGDTVILDAGQGYVVYDWSTNENTRQINAWEEGWYFVEATDHFGYKDIDSLFLTVYPSPEVELGPDIHACVEDTVIISAGINYEHILWSTGSTEDSIIVTSSGKYTVSVFNEFGCTSSDSIEVDYQSVEVDLGADTTIHESDSFFASPGYSSGTSYLWHNGSTDASILISSSSFVSDSLKIWVQVWNTIGCEGIDSMMVYMIPDPEPPKPVIRIMPVPTREFVTVSSNYIISEIKCYDVYGNFIFSKYYNSESCNINLSSYARAIYFLRIKLITGHEEIHRAIRL